jgi:hypothetical protein
MVHWIKERLNGKWMPWRKYDERGVTVSTFFCEKLKEIRQSYQSLVAFNSAPVLPQARAKFSPAPSRSQGGEQWFGRTLPLAANVSAYSWALASRLPLELKYFWKAAVGTFQVIVLYGDIHGEQLTSIIIYTYTKCQSSCSLASHWTRAYHVKARNSTVSWQQLWAVDTTFIRR